MNRKMYYEARHRLRFFNRNWYSLMMDMREYVGEGLEIVYDTLL